MRVDGKINLEASLQTGEVLLKTLALSLDPYLRLRMREPEIKSYTPALEVSRSVKYLVVGSHRTLLSRSASL